MSDKTFKKENRSKLIFFFCFLFLSIGFVYYFPRISLPLIVSYFLSMLIEPLFPYFQSLKLNRFSTIIIFIAFIMIVSILPFFKIIPILKAESENLQIYIPKIEAYVSSIYSQAYNFIKLHLNYEIEDQFLLDSISNFKIGMKELIIQAPNILARILEWLFLMPFFLFFILKDGNKVKKTILSFLPNSIFERTYFLYFHFNKKFANYMMAKFVEASIVGIIITTGLLILDVRFAVLIGVIAGVTNIIPYVGPFLGVIPAIIVCLIEFGVGPDLFSVLVLFAVANIVDMFLVFPVLVSKVVNLHPIVVVLSVIIGSQFLGILGMIISIPLAAVIKLLIFEIYRELYHQDFKT